MSIIKISAHYLDDLTWKDSAVCDFVINNSVDVWRINISSNLSVLNDFLAIINPGELARANRYYHAKDRNRFIISRGALRIILGKYLNHHPAAIEFEIGINKKPHIKNPNNTGIFYNISHAGDWILLGISNANIGVDTEQINYDYNYKDVLQDNFSREEIDFINQTMSFERFFMLWTRKEALTKATGKGLDSDLKLIPCLEGIHFAQSDIMSSTHDWLINTFKLNENNLGSIAINPGTASTRFWDISF
jgi:4'-phosphopantetheinyl transferase